jgi:chromosome condensin MukBEF ATPase and DNA-binding subunit MukB
MFNRKQKEIDSLNARCVELARMVRNLKNENADLRSEIDEKEDTIKLVNKLMTSNQYDNNQVIRNKIIELTSDYQSIC